MPATKYGSARKGTASSSVKKPRKPDTYVCTRCGTVFNKAERRKNFATVHSPLWESNEYKLPVCNDCLKFYYDFYLRALGDVYSAYRRICMKFDIYYSEDIVNSITDNEQTSDRIGAYISQLNFARHSDKTYDNTIEEDGNKIIYGDCIYNAAGENGEGFNYKEAYEKLKQCEEERQNNGDSGETDSEILTEFEKIFTGDAGFRTKEQKIMIQLYNEQIEHLPPQLIATLDETVKNMARFKILQNRAIEHDDMKAINTYASQFNAARKYIDSAVEKFKKNAASEDSSLILGSLIESIENFNPAVIYKKKSVFADVDGIGSLISRFMGRPVKNFFTGSREPDSEYSIDSE